MFETIRADIERYYAYGYTRKLVFLLFEQHQIWAIICYRFGNYLSKNHLPLIVRFVLKAIYQLWWKQIQFSMGIYISGDATIGPGLYIGHFGQIFIGANSVLGASCNISQGVTLGLARRAGKWGAPQLGDRVYLAPGAKVIGPVFLADGVVVGANAVMSRDAPENSVWAGIPARVIGYSGSAEYMGNGQTDIPVEPVG